MTDSASTATTAHRPQPPAPVRQAIWCLWGSWLCGFIRGVLAFSDGRIHDQYVQTILKILADQQAQLPDGQEMPQIDPDTVGHLVRTSLNLSLWVGGFISLGITALILRKLKLGRNWARIVSLIFGAYSFYGTISLFQLYGFGLMSALTVGYLGLGYYALYLLFTAPGADWFRKRADAAPDAKW